MRKTPVDIELPYNTRKLRQTLRLTQEAYAAELGIAEITVGTHERGITGISPETMLKLAELAGRKANEPGYDHGSLRRLQQFFLSRVADIQANSLSEMVDSSSLDARKWLRLTEKQAASGDAEAKLHLLISEMDAAQLHARHDRMLNEARDQTFGNYDDVLKRIEFEQSIRRVLRTGREARARSGGD